MNNLKCSPYCHGVAILFTWVLMEGLFYSGTLFKTALKIVVASLP